MEKTQFSQHFGPLLPAAPGIYKYYDRDKKLLYVGKAKNIKKRVSSYFVKAHDNRKTAHLVEAIANIEWTITNNEHDAFLLENSLIKHFKPPYNINLKDDKSYPYVVLKREPFPRIFLTRRFIADGSEYFGPYTDVGSVKTLLDLIRGSIPLRTCNLPLTKDKISKGKFKVCLEYHLGNCKGPCEGFQSESDYMESIAQIRHILKGNLTSLVQELKEKMKAEAAALEFEKAETTRKKLEALQNYQNKSTVVSRHLKDIDVISLIDGEQNAFVNYMMVKQGKILQSQSLEVEKKLEESAEDILAYALAFLRLKFQSTAKEVIVPFPVPTTETDLKLSVPKLGEKKNLLDLSLKNAGYYKVERRKKQSLFLEGPTEADRQALLEQLQDDLQLPALPRHIECFDNSNFQGSFPVAAMVCFREGLPFKKDYRHFHIKTVEGINDFASMSEIVKRRYDRLLKTQQDLPQLVIIDGGKGQLSAAMKSIEELGLTGRMTLIGLAKREESIFYPGDQEPLQLPYNGSSLLLLRRIRDEVHRFGITFHRKTRSKGTIKNELEDIPGIGKQTAQLLLSTYRSVTKIKGMTLRELTGVIGASKARMVYSHFHPEAP